MGQLERLQPLPVEDKWSAAVHDAEYVKRVETACRNAPSFVDSLDTPVCGKSYEVARLAAGGGLVAVDAVVAGQARNAFCTARPGGHHAMPERGMGFCLFHHVAIAARYAQRQHHLERNLIVDCGTADRQWGNRGRGQRRGGAAMPPISPSGMGIWPERVASDRQKWENNCRGSVHKKESKR